MESSGAYRVRLGLLILGLLSLGSARADERAAADLLPDSTVVFAEVMDPAELINLAHKHPLRSRFESLQVAREGMNSQGYLHVKAVVSVIEAKLGQTWPRLIESATGQGISLGIDAKTNGVAVLIKAADDQTLPRMIGELIELARTHARSEARDAAVSTVEYRGLTVYELDKARVATFGEWLLVCNNSDLSRDILDRYLDQGPGQLSAIEGYGPARASAVDSASAADSASAWVYVNTRTLRDRGLAKELFEGKTENPLAELILGGLVDSMKHTPYVAASLTAATEYLSVRVVMPHQDEWTTESRKYYFGPQGEGFAPTGVEIRDPLLSISTYRDISAMWLHAGDLFNERMADELAKADSSLTTLFSGKDFGDEILGAVRPEIQLVAARQSFGAEQPQPAIKLPAFAAIFRLKKPETMQPEFRRIFQSLIGFLNIVGSMNGQPQLDLDMEKNDAGQMITATYLVDAAETSRQDLKINYNFSPSVAFTQDYFVVSSTKELAQEISSALQSSLPGALTTNTWIAIDPQQGNILLADNREQLIAQNMLTEGHSRAEAEAAISDLLTLVAAVRSVSLELTRHNDRLQLDLRANFTNSH